MKHSLFSYCRILAGCLAFSLAFSLASNAAHAQTLTVTTDLQLWLKADAGVTDDGSDNVLSWADQSPSPDAASQIAAAPDVPNTPKRILNALNGKPVLRFDGVDDYLGIPDTASLSITGDITTFFVVKFDDFATFRAVWAKTQGNQPAPTDFYTQPGSGFPQVYRGDGTGGQLAPFQSNVALTAATYQTVGFAMEGTTCSHFIGGSVTSSGTIDVIEADTDAALLIGTRGDLFTKMKGDIAEILIYDRALTPAERASVASYLGLKYGIANEPPTISLSATPAGPSHPSGTTLTLTATANDTDGTITNVKFFANGTLIGTATAPPYSIGVTLETAGSYTFTARATDDRSGITDSAPVVRTATAGAPPTLGVTATLQLWLKADAGVTTGAGDTVLTWADQSGHANDAVATDELTAPIVAAGAVNGLPAIRFDGADDSLQVADSVSVSITGNITSFFVVKMDDFGTFRSVWAKTAGNLPAPTDFYTLPGSGIPRVFRGDGTFGSLANVDGAAALHAGSFDLVGFSAAGASLTHFLNGQPNGTGVSTTGTADTDRPLWIGTRDDGVTRMKGDIAELLIYDTALSAVDLRSVQIYLGARYGVPLASPVNAAPTVTLTAPTPGGSGVAPVDVTISANAADLGGSVVKVEFIVNGGVAATDQTAPFSASVNFPVASVATIEARATDNLGAVTLSAPITFTVTSPEPNPLPDLAHLRLWLRGDRGVTETGGAVSAWNDQSGSFNNATQTIANQRPTLVPNAINGKPALRFDGANDSLAVAHAASLAITGDISSFFVVKYDDFASFNAVWGKTQGNQPASTDFYTAPGSGIPRVFRGNGLGPNGVVAAASASTAGRYAIVGFDMAGTTLRHYLNGVANGDGQINAPLGDTGAPLWVGTRGDQFTRMKGDIAELIIYDSALSDTDRGTLFAYLASRYGIIIYVPTGNTQTLTSSGTYDGIVIEDGGTLTLGTPAPGGALAAGAAQPASAGGNSSATGNAASPDPLAKKETPPITDGRGHYIGLFDSGVAGAPKPGIVNVTVTRKGRFTGTIRYEGRSYRLIGKLDAQRQFAGVARGRGNAKLAVSLQLDLAGETEKLTGTITDGEKKTDFLADRAGVPANTGVALRRDVVIAAPSGDRAGQGIVRVQPAGTVRLVGKLSDGTPISSGGQISKRGLWPYLIAPRKTSAGEVSGIISLSDLQTAPLQ